LTTPTYRALDQAKIIGTLEQLRDRIGERFPESGLREVAVELIAVAKEASRCIDYIRAPNWPIRIMHQLTKDPEQLLSSEPSTPSSPERTLSPPELGRYLDYCSELLSVTSKLAALLVQYFNDDVVLRAVNEIEALTTGLSGKIWQKIRLLERTPVV
jgi:hypothetical protein